MKTDNILKLYRQIWYSPWDRVADGKMKLKRQSIVERLGYAPLPTKHGNFTLVAYGDKTTGEEHFALVYGNLENGALGNGKNVLIRIHSSCVTGEIFTATNCECPEQLAEALSEIATLKRGVFIYLHQEGRGNGTKGKLAQLANMFHFDGNKILYDMDTDTAFHKAGYEGERRDFSVAGAILKDLKVKSVCIMTNNPQKIAGLKHARIKIMKRKAIIIEAANEVVANDLLAKKVKLGHLL